MTQLMIQRIFLSSEIILAFVIGVKIFLTLSEWKLRLRSRRSRFPRRVESGTPVLLYFWTSDCAQCPPQERQIERARSVLQQSGKTLHVQKLNALEEQTLATRMNVMTVPTTVLLNSDGMVAAWNPGLTQARKIVEQYSSLNYPV